MKINPYIFREYDIRGIVDKDFPEDLIINLGRALGTYYKEHNVGDITLGRDCRLSSPALHKWLIKGILSTGCSVLDTGICHTPLLYFSLFHLPVEGGVMITGSHNPPDNNGFKICLGKSTIYGEEIQNIRKIMEEENFSSGNGRVTEIDIKPLYKEEILKRLEKGRRRLKVVIDAGNGTGGLLAPDIYRDLGMEVIELYCNMDGHFPFHHPDPTEVKNMKDLIKKVEETGADLGIAFDGDADRIGVVNEQGGIIWGDELMILFSREILKENPGASFIAEVKCSQTLFDDIEKHGGHPIMWKVGHSLIKKKLSEEGSLLAGEMSGHIFFAHRYFGFDDAVYAGGRVLEILSKTEQSLSKLLSDIPPTVNTPEIRFPCPEAIKFDIVKKIVEHFKKEYKVVDIDGARIIFPGGWALVRASNTQPLLVMRFEGKTSEILDTIKKLVEEKVYSFFSR
ncbi:MAG TPA: phosphomannomutase/phosphoglucomutase [Candidatus Eremiobacteraeota bacterium]|nr:MAG: Phosphomannomutase/phosphoglucomutase [bacterium ADurb.Bin363]HPZ10560.1 phosphomannomutase/phosphoglucomutase [Candidatus Eremiobacteraeota bacterium]